MCVWVMGRRSGGVGDGGGCDAASISCGGGLTGAAVERRVLGCGGVATVDIGRVGFGHSTSMFPAWNARIIPDSNPARMQGLLYR